MLNDVAFIDIFQDSKWLQVSAAKGWTQHSEFVFRDLNNKILISAFGYVNKSRLGNYLYIQHGPVFDKSLINESEKSTAQKWGELDLNEEGKKASELFLENLKQEAFKLNCFLIILEPLATIDNDFDKLLIEKGYERQKWSILPRYPMFIDMKVNEEEQLATMDKSTRYNIRYAEKQGVKIEFVYPGISSETEVNDAIDSLYKLLGENSKQKGYSLPGKKFFTEAANQYSGQHNICFALAKYNNEVISANFTQIYGKWAGSYYTANSRNFPKLKASYLLKWATILEAKSKGAEVFDMWGRIPNLPTNHPEYGYSQFKLGFNPILKEFSGRMILPLSKPKYLLWKIMGRLRYSLSH